MKVLPSDRKLNFESGPEGELYRELLSVATHDVRSPLGAISIFCELLLTSEKSLDAAQTRNIELISEAAQKAQLILEDTSEISRIYSGSLPILRETFSLREAVREAVTDMGSQTIKNSVTVEESIVADSLAVLGDRGRFIQILLRLLEEAIPSAGKDGTVVLSGTYSAEENVVSLSVTSSASGPTVVRPLYDSLHSLKGRLANRKVGESRYSLLVAARVASLMGGDLELGPVEEPFHAVINLPGAA